MKAQDTVVAFKIDTGAQVNLLPFAEYTKMKNKPRITKNNVTIKAYNGSAIENHGMIKAEVKFKDQVEIVQFMLVDVMQPIMGLKSAETFGLIKRIDEIQDNVDLKQELMEKYPSVFDETKIGCLPVIHTIRLDKEAIPSIDPQRKVAVAIRKDYKKALDNMVALNVIKKIVEPTRWVSSLVLVRKKSVEIRVCLDPKNLNDSIMREHYHIPVKSELTSEMANAKYFTKLDAKMAFWQIPLDVESQKLCTFNTPFGRYCYLRLPYGITSASEVFHRTVTQIFDDLEGVKVYIDDLIIWGENKDQHDERLHKVLERAMEANFVLNLKKCEFRMKKITYLGEVLSSKGVHPDPEKIRAITEMPLPTSKKDVQRLFGTVNYLGKFILNLTKRTTAIRSLIENKTEWQWNKEHSDEWNDLKETLTSSPILKHYDLSKETKIPTDASKKGLGAVLLQKHEGDWLPVAYASRALTATEQRYAAIEKEALGLVFGCTKFDEYIFGRQIILETDHKPLLSIHKKPLADASPRIQRLMLKLLRYDITMEWTPGKNLHIPDTLSRAFLKNSDKNDEELTYHVNAVLEDLPVSKEMWSKIATYTECDPALQEVAKSIAIGWKTRALNQYYHYRDEMTMINGVILKGKRVVIPKKMQSEMLKIIHEGHLGIEKCKRRARDVLYWPNMNKDIEDLAGKCSVCMKHQYAQTKEPLIQHERPAKPWVKVGADLFHFYGKDYLLVIDYFSNYPEVALLPDITSATIITKMKSIFARHGIPRELVSDNGKQFDSMEFQKFTTQYQISHITSSPTYPQSNGQAEKGVQIVKRLLKKAKENDSDPYIALLNYRSTPLDCGKSPAELLMNRKLRTRLPDPEELLPVSGHDQRRTSIQWYNQHAHVLKPLNPNEVVRVRNDGQWSLKARVIKQDQTPRSYLVETETGKVLRRNRKHLLFTKETIDDEPDDMIASTPEPKIDAPESPVVQNEEVSPTSCVNPVHSSPVCSNPVRTTRSGRCVNTPAR